MLATEKLDLLFSDPIFRAHPAFAPQRPVIEKPQTGQGYAIAKRGIDIVASLLLLIACAPLMLIIAALIKIDSHGPVFFLQRRSGLNGSVFRIIKFRSMRVMEDANDVRHARVSDDRVTRVGLILRRSSLDELPQFINVLLGDMSIVGPRPHAMIHDHQIARVVPSYTDRFQAKPGITGLAQIRGLRGECHTVQALLDRIAADREYITAASLWLDLSIIAMTVPRMVMDYTIVERAPREKSADRLIGDNEQPRLIGGVAVAVTTRVQALKQLTAAIRSGSAVVWGFCNAHTVNLARTDRVFRDTLSQMTLLNDGAGVDAASRLLYGDRFPENLNGTDFTPALLDALPEGTPVYLLGGKPGVASDAAVALGRSYPAIRMAGSHHGYFSADENAQVIDDIRRSGARLVLVAMGQPVQESWAVHHAPQLGSVMLCVGAFLDFAAGRVSRAPEWVQSLRLEWVYRLIQEPSRLANRYLIGNVAFIRAVLRERAARRF